MVDWDFPSLRPKEIGVSTVVDRLAALAEFSDTAAVQLSKPELAGHALSYRADAERLARRET